MKILVTGGTGFIGKFLLAELLKQGHFVRAAIRPSNKLASGVEVFEVAEANAPTDWVRALHGIDTLIHLVARTHILKETGEDTFKLFRQVNVEVTRTLALAAVKAGVKRFVYVSSVKANGEGAERPYSEKDVSNPQDAYGVTKWEAEQVLHKISAETGMEVVIVRPPLVYGKGVKGNFAQMIQVLKKGYPLPLSSIRNLRSLIYVENLVDALILCATHPNAAGQTYLVSDGEDISTPDLLRELSYAMKKPVKLLPFSSVLIRLAGQLLGKSGQVDKLMGSLQVDSSKIRLQLNWKPPYSLREGIKRTVQDVES